MAKMKKCDLINLYNYEIDHLKKAIKMNSDAVQTIALARIHTYGDLLERFYALTNSERLHIESTTKISLKTKSSDLSETGRKQEQ